MVVDTQFLYVGRLAFEFIIVLINLIGGIGWFGGRNSFDCTDSRSIRIYFQINQCFTRNRINDYRILVNVKNIG